MPVSNLRYRINEHIPDPAGRNQMLTGIKSAMFQRSGMLITGFKNTSDITYSVYASLSFSIHIWSLPFRFNKYFNGRTSAESGGSMILLFRDTERALLKSSLNTVTL